MTAEELVNDPYIKCEDIRLTVFEKAGSIQRVAVNGGDKGRRFKSASQSYTNGWNQ